MVACETCGNKITKEDKKVNESNTDRCGLCVKMDLYELEERKNTNQKKRKKKCSGVPDEHIRRRTQWTLLRGNSYRALADTEESDDEK